MTFAILRFVIIGLILISWVYTLIIYPNKNIA